MSLLCNQLRCSIWHFTPLVLALEALEAPRLVVHQRHRRVEGTGVEPDPLARDPPGDLDHPGEGVAAEAMTDMLGEEAEVDDLGAPFGVGGELRIPDPGLAIEEELPGLHPGGGEIPAPVVLTPLQSVAPMPLLPDRFVVVAVEGGDGGEDEAHRES